MEETTKKELHYKYEERWNEVYAQYRREQQAKTYHQCIKDVERKGYVNGTK